MKRHDADFDWEDVVAFLLLSPFLAVFFLAVLLIAIAATVWAAARGAWHGARDAWSLYRSVSTEADDLPY